MKGTCRNGDAWAEGDRGSQMTLMQSGRKECVEIDDVVERMDGWMCLWLEYMWVEYTIRTHDSELWLGSSTPS